MNLFRKTPSLSVWSSESSCRENAKTVATENPSSLKDLLFLVIPVAGALFAGSAALYANAAGFSAGPNIGNVDAVPFLLIGITLPVVLVYGLKRFPQNSARLIVAGVAVAGTVSGLILLKVSLEAAGVAPVVFLITLPMGYLGLNWSVKGYFGSLSQKQSTTLMVVSATLLGALIGTSLPSVFAITFLIALTALDVAAVESNTVSVLVGKANYDQVISAVTLPLEKSLVGLGDFLTYSILSAVALHVLGVFGAIETAGLILIGALATFQITRARRKVSGLLIPVSFGLIPIVLGLFHA